MSRVIAMSLFFAYSVPPEMWRRDCPAYKGAVRRHNLLMKPRLRSMTALTQNLQFTLRHPLLRDRDAIFGNHFREQVRDMGICEVLSAPRSPWQRA